ncbi:MAG: hypothetical protein HDT13_10645 [Butyrivibrio sp.]|nr:hypothetical protein [Butyrivibrio sp.]
MGIKTGVDVYDNLYSQYLQEELQKQVYDGLTGERSEVQSCKSFPETAVVYEKSEAYDFPAYSVSSVQSSLSDSALNSKMKTYLSDLGFYNGEKGGAYTEEFKTALKCFQQAYWGSERCDLKNGIPSMLQSQIESVGAAYYTNLTNSRLTDALKKLGFSSPSTELKQNFARIQTFFEKGMGCTKYQVAGIMGNIMQESTFDPKAERKSSGAFGILQWNGNRRKFLEDFASKGGYSYENMGVQFAYFRYEVSSTWKTDCLGGYAQNSNYVDSWRKFKSDYQHDFYGASDFFFDNIEQSYDSTKQIRRNYSSIIYQAIC